MKHLFVVFFCSFSLGASAATFQNFDVPGATYTATNHYGSSSGVVAEGNPGNAYRLTPDHFSTQNSIAFDQTDVWSAGAAAFTFDFRIHSPAYTGADGIGFALINTAHYGSSGGLAAGWGTSGMAEEPNFTDSFGLGLDTWNNGTPEDQPAGPNSEALSNVSLHFGGFVENVSVHSQINFEDAYWHQVAILLNPVLGGSNVTVTFTDGQDGDVVTAYDNYFIDGLTPYSSRLAFAGRTGGDNANHDIDNISGEFGLIVPEINGAQLSVALALLFSLVMLYREREGFQYR